MDLSAACLARAGEGLTIAALDHHRFTIDDLAMTKCHVLIVAVDGLRASSLGAYGNTTFPTPALDQFAAESLLLDASFATSADLASIYRALWQSWHPLRPATNGDAASLPRLFAQHGYRTTLVTDERELFSLPKADHFHERIVVNASDANRLSIAGAFAAARESITPVQGTVGEQPQMIWLHTRGLYDRWQAPVELQLSLLDEGDPPPVEAGEPPDFEITRQDDPDTSFRYGCAYAAQVMWLDDCWGDLMACVSDAGSIEKWLVMLIGVRGFPLGEHGRIGGVDLRLYVEQLHVPWLMRFPDGRGQLSRCASLTTHLDLLPTMATWLAESTSGEQSLARLAPPSACDGLSLLPLFSAVNSPWRDAILSSNDDNLTLRTSEWSLRKNQVAELFVRPDDRWEANDVAALCPDVASMLAQSAQQAADQLRQGLQIPAKLLSADGQAETA
jgi:arylsulfatase A-like enzyme